MHSFWRYSVLSILSGLLYTDAASVKARQSSITVNSTVLVLARDSASAAAADTVLQGYGIPYQEVIVPQSGVTLPILNSSTTAGAYGSIVTVSELAYNYNGTWQSALTTDQWNTIYAYQEAFGVRLVRLDVFPGPNFGVNDTSAVGTEEFVSITNSSSFGTANLKENAGVSTAGIFHYPAAITDASVAYEIAAFKDSSGTKTGVAAVINTHGTRQQQVWFMPWAADWSTTSNFLSHAWIHWMTRGLYLGFRRVYFNTQIDDMFLETDLYQPANTSFRIVPEDLSMHITWTADINSRMPAGSKYIMEIGHNGNGNIESAVDIQDGEQTVDTNVKDEGEHARRDIVRRQTTCNPDTGIEYPDQIDTPLEFMKPLGTGTSIWPDTPTSYKWSLACTQLDPLEQFFGNTSNLNAFYHISHTFTHEDEDNATYSDVTKEISWNVDWLKQVGISDAIGFSPNGIIPPAITGLHNGDALKAWLDNGIKYVVGDNTRPGLMTQKNTYWPLITDVAANGYAGVTVMGRWATTIYYNCNTPDCTVAEWIATSAGKGDFSDLLLDAKATNTRHLLGLHWDPFMFHQANLRVHDVDEMTINGVTKQYSLLMAWVETVVPEMVRLTDWPFVTLKHDDIALQWIARMTRDQCSPSMTYTLSSDRTSITAVTVNAANTACGTTIPFTVPADVGVASAGTATKEQLGSDPLTLWVQLAGSAQTFQLSKAIPV